MGDLQNSVGLSSYKLAQFVFEHIEQNRPDLKGVVSNIQGIEEAITSVAEPDERYPDRLRKRHGIHSRTARRWLRRLGYNWRDVKKGVFLDGHERPDVVEYRQSFLEEMHRLSPYFVEFSADGLIKEKKYPADCSVGGLDRRPIIIITHDEIIFSTNDVKHQAWIPENGAFLRPKGKGKGLMVSDFLLPWSRLNLFSLPKTQQDELVNAGIPMEAATTFEYGNDEGHWDGAKLLQQIFDRALPIAEALYPGYELLFLFDNATSHSTYAEDALRTNKMNKGDGGQQSFLRNGWFRNEDTIHSQQMWYFQQDPTRGSQVRVQKGIQHVLEE